MFFGELPLDQAEGAILAHSYRSAQGQGKIRKGERLTEPHLAILHADGVTHVTVARLDDDDLHENQAALIIATALAGENTRLGQAATGRVNVHAICDGLLAFSAQVIHAINCIDESITVATLPPATRVAAGQIVATIKIITYAAASSHVDKAVTEASSSFVVHSFCGAKVCLIQTKVPTTKDSVLDKTRTTTENRLLERQAILESEQRTAHSISELCVALEQAQSQTPDWILIFGASATSDRNDVVPVAIVQSGGSLVHFGMPVDPGNLLLLGNLDNSIVIGMPGCARSSKFNGVDKVLDKLSCGLPVTREWITGLGVGGLLQEIVDRPRPRVVVREKSSVSALLLGAGSSSRFGEANKLLVRWRGEPLIQHVLKTIAASDVSGTLLVTGHEGDRIKKHANKVEGISNLRLLHNNAYSTGMASSLIKGVSALIDSDAIIVCLGDMPFVSSAVINELLDVFKQRSDKALYIPTYEGRRGNPVLIARQLYDSVLNLEGDTGARVLARRFPDTVMEVPTDCAGILHDVDTPADLDAN